MRHRTLMSAALALLFAFSATGLLAQQLPREALALVELWLTKNCDVGSEPTLVAELKEWGDRLETPFLRALETGPSTETLTEVERLASARFADRQKLLESGGDLGLSEEDLKAARSETREGYLKRQKDDLVNRYRAQAVSGLGLVGGQRAAQVLERLAGDESSPLQLTAREALERLRSEGPDA